jgi:hypothetical protein
MRVEVVNFEAGHVYCDDGTLLPIVSWRDADNNPTCDFAEAVTFIAGHGRDWYAGKVSDWKQRTLN